MCTMTLVATWMTILISMTGADEMWKKDMSEEIYIEASTEGFQLLELSCGPTEATLRLVMDDDFDGVIYTRGSFMKKPVGCFYDAEEDDEHTLTIPYEKCDFKADEEGFLTQTIIIQHDDWLIFPGDLAFTLQCKITGEDAKSKIGLADPDPAAKELPKHRKSTVEGEASVVFTPDDVRPRKKPRTKKLKQEL